MAKTKKIKPIAGEFYLNPFSGLILMFTDSDTWVYLQGGYQFGYREIDRRSIKHLPDFKDYVWNYSSSDNIEEEYHHPIMDTDWYKAGPGEGYRWLDLDEIPLKTDTYSYPFIDRDRKIVWGNFTTCGSFIGKTWEQQVEIELKHGRSIKEVIRFRRKLDQ